MFFCHEGRSRLVYEGLSLRDANARGASRGAGGEVGGGSVAAGDLKEKHARTCVFGGCCSLAELVEKVPVLWRLGCSEVPQWCLQRWATRKSLAASKSFVGNKASLVSFGV